MSLFEHVYQLFLCLSTNSNPSHSFAFSGASQITRFLLLGYVFRATLSVSSARWKAQIGRLSPRDYHLLYTLELVFTRVCKADGFLNLYALPPRGTHKAIVVIAAPWGLGCLVLDALGDNNHDGKKEKEDSCRPLI